MTETNVNTAVGAEKIPALNLTPQETGPKRSTFTRMAQHFLTNNNTSTTPTVTIRTNAAGTTSEVNFASSYYADFDQGYVNIPYYSTTQAMEAADWDTILCQASKFRIAECGFKIIHLQCCQQTVTSSGSTTTVTNQFTQAPKIFMVVDDDGVLGTNGTVFNTASVVPSQCANLIVAPGTANKDMAPDFNGGLLPSIHWLQPAAPGTTASAYTAYSMLNGGNVKILTTGDTYSYKWTNADTNVWIGTHNLSNSPFLEDETTRQLAIYGPATPGSMTAALMYQLSTNVLRNLKHVPVGHYLRVPPCWTQLGPVIVNLDMYVEYFMTIEYMTGRYLGTRLLSGLDGSSLAGNFLPYPIFRRDVVALSTDNIPPPTLRGDDSRKRKRPEETAPGGPSSKQPPAQPKQQDQHRRPTDQTDGRQRKRNALAYDSDVEEVY